MDAHRTDIELNDDSPSEEHYFDIPFEEFPLKVVGAFNAENGEAVELPWATVEFDPEVGLTFSYLQDILAELPGAETHLHTSNGHDLLLFRNGEGTPDKGFWKLVRSHFFEFAIQSNYRLYEDDSPRVFDSWALAGEALKGHSNASPTKLKMLDDGRMQYTVDTPTQFEGSVPVIGAELKASIQYDLKSSIMNGLNILPVPQYEFSYAAPITLEELQKHEVLFRTLLDFIWCRGHGVPIVYLGLGGKRSRLLRKGVHVPNTADTYRALQFNRYLKAAQVACVHEHLLAWANAWFAMSDTERRPFVQAARLLRSPAMQTDLRFAGALHCLEALDKRKPQKAKPDGKPTFLNDRLKRLGHRWIDVDRSPTISILPHLDRVAYTRNDIIHLEPHPKLIPGDLLEGTEITRSYYEAIAMIRAAFLDTMGMPASVGDDYAHSVLKELSLIQYRYS